MTTQLEQSFVRADHFIIVDSKTGKQIGTYKTRAKARSIADKKDLEYGAIRYIVKAIYTEAN